MKIVANEQRGMIEVKSATVRQWLEAVITIDKAIQQFSFL